MDFVYLLSHRYRFFQPNLIIDRVNDFLKMCEQKLWFYLKLFLCTIHSTLSLFNAFHFTYKNKKNFIPQKLAANLNSLQTHSWNDWICIVMSQKKTKKNVHVRWWMCCWCGVQYYLVCQ